MRLGHLLALTLICAPVLSAQSAASTPSARFADSARVWIEASGMDVTRLDSVATYLDRALTVVADDPHLLHYRGYVEYRLVIARMISGTPLSTLAGRLAIADGWLARSGSLRWPETPALRATLTGLMIGADPGRAPELAMQIGGFWGEAASLGGEQNPRVLLLQAYGMQGTPPEYGGGADKARVLAKRAAAAFATDRPAPLAPAWGADEVKQLLAELGDR